jgi:hypothetical protein
MNYAILKRQNKQSNDSRSIQVYQINQGDVDGMDENLIALIPHQFGDHSKCQERFCGYKHKPNVTYIHRSLPYRIHSFATVSKMFLLQLLPKVLLM